MALGGHEWTQRWCFPWSGRLQEPVQPFSFLRCKPIGVMQMVDQGEQDDKIIAGGCADQVLLSFVCTGGARKSWQQAWQQACQG